MTAISKRCESHLEPAVEFKSILFFSTYQQLYTTGVLICMRWSGYNTLTSLTSRMRHTLELAQWRRNKHDRFLGNQVALQSRLAAQRPPTLTLSIYNVLVTFNVLG